MLNILNFIKCWISRHLSPDTKRPCLRRFELTEDRQLKCSIFCCICAANLQLESRCRKIVIRCLENKWSVALCLYYESIQTWEVLHFKSRSPSPLLSLTAQQVTCLFFHCLELSEMGFYIYVPLFIDAWVNLFAKFLKIYMVLVS